MSKNALTCSGSVLLGGKNYIEGRIFVCSRLRESQIKSDSMGERKIQGNKFLTQKIINLTETWATVFVHRLRRNVEHTLDNKSLDVYQMSHLLDIGTVVSNRFRSETETLSRWTLTLHQSDTHRCRLMQKFKKEIETLEPKAVSQRHRG